ncbi:transposase [Falsiroseomonas selenitidurans]|uniref:transposase n=1 Tax=Falsiroseomonas selenitidurans TaxID=2716335 RepID=UPI002E2AC555|nr:transposase [Falsiroseomonas selenitidurans]
MLDVIFRIARTGAPWRDLPAELGNWNLVLRQFRRWTASGLWDVTLEALADGGGADLLPIPADDRQHRHPGAPLRRRRKAGTPQAGLGRARGGFTSKLHIHGNAHGLPIALHVTAGQEADCSKDDALMEARDGDPGIMLANKDDDSEPIRQDLRGRGAAPENPTRRNRRVLHCVSRPLHALRCTSSASSTASRTAAASPPATFRLPTASSTSPCCPPSVHESDLSTQPGSKPLAGRIPWPDTALVLQGSSAANSIERQTRTGGTFASDEALAFQVSMTSEAAHVLDAGSSLKAATGHAQGGTRYAPPRYPGCGQSARRCDIGSSS